MKNTKVTLIILSLFLLVSFNLQAKNKRSSKAHFSLHIFSSSNITGNIEPCG
ncbi:hypothetical protein H8E88_12340 [candidate division KSB1 bacterium]|nr:hypothetical protein [candidate division KSB1 bacterium]MBL7095695.1 hypothetical protein [candidate division KSB1 bacterium]